MRRLRDRRHRHVVHGISSRTLQWGWRLASRVRARVGNGLGPLLAAVIVTACAGPSTPVAQATATPSAVQTVAPTTLPTTSPTSTPQPKVTVGSLGQYVVDASYYATARIVNASDLGSSLSGGFPGVAFRLPVGAEIRAVHDGALGQMRFSPRPSVFYQMLTIANRDPSRADGLGPTARQLDIIGEGIEPTKDPWALHSSTFAVGDVVAIVRDTKTIDGLGEYNVMFRWEAFKPAVGRMDVQYLTGELFGLPPGAISTAAPGAAVAASPASRCPQAKWSVAGRAIDAATGAPVAGVGVSAAPPDSFTGVRFDPDDLSRASTGPNGEYSMCVKAGLHWVDFIPHPEYQPQFWNDVTRGVSGPLTVRGTDLMVDHDITGIDAHLKRS